VPLEKTLVQQCCEAAEGMGAMVAVVGQRKAKGSGTTSGYPDLTLICSGHTILIELKRPKEKGDSGGVLSLGQQAFIYDAAQQGVTVPVISRLGDFIDLVNWCRKHR
jgi:hypothetical protein